MVPALEGISDLTCQFVKNHLRFTVARCFWVGKDKLFIKNPYHNCRLTRVKNAKIPVLLCLEAHFPVFGPG
jgi:hypothetical protein